jgi:hypothetical protein
MARHGVTGLHQVIVLVYGAIERGEFADPVAGDDC